MAPGALNGEFSRTARVRLGEVFRQFETNPQPSRFAIVRSRWFPERESLGEAAPRLLRSAFGYELEVDPFDLQGFSLTASSEQIAYFIMGVSAHLQNLAKDGGLPFAAPREFAERVNTILEHEAFPWTFDERKIGWSPRISSEAEILRRTLLSDRSEMASCAQGDPQVEMVVSTVQGVLARPNPVLVDYGAGLGRVLAGFATADLFRMATYIAIDEPVSQEVKSLATTVGSKFISQSRSDFLRAPSAADVAILMNTLHHIPFQDIPRQMSTLLGAVKSDGILVVQEIGELREPEKRNVPWRIEHIVELFTLPNCKPNPRSMVTRSKKVPLTHLLLHIDGPLGKESLEGILKTKCRSIWQDMKVRTLDEIAHLYQAGDPNDEIALHHALITNANLDLNKPE